MILRVDEADQIARVKVVNGEELAQLDTTGTLTQKYQARLVPGDASHELIAAVDTNMLLPHVRAGADLAENVSPVDHPAHGLMLPIAEVFERLSGAVGRSFPDAGWDQERNRGAALHRIVCELLGYADYRDDGRFPDVRNQLLEVKLQTSPTIDLGLVRPASEEPLDVPQIAGTQVRHCDVRYALFYVVAPGSIHPDTGRTYTVDPLADTAVAEAPTELAAALSKEAVAEASDSGDMSPERLAEMLEVLDPVTFAGDKPWLDLAMACHHATGGEDVFIAWSLGDATYSPNEGVSRRRWRSMRADGRRRPHHRRHTLRGRPGERQGIVRVAFVIDAFARRIAGWRVSRTAHAGFVLDALEQAVHRRQPGAGLVHHSDRGSQYPSIRHTERLAEAGIEPSAGSVGDSHDNAPAETIDGLFKAEVIHRRGPWRSFDAVEYATLEWVDWSNNRRLLEPIANIPPAEADANFHAAPERSNMAA